LPDTATSQITIKFDDFRRRIFSLGLDGV